MREIFHIFLRADLDERELSVSLYHEVLEAATVAAELAPDAVLELNEGHFEQAAQSAHERLGFASPATLNRLLAEFGFGGWVARMKREIELLLLKLTDGARILRLSEPRSGLCLEKRLDAQESVARQKERWKNVFAAMLERELGAAR